MGLNGQRRAGVNTRGSAALATCRIVAHRADIAAAVDIVIAGDHHRRVIEELHADAGMAAAISIAAIDASGVSRGDSRAAGVHTGTAGGIVSRISMTACNATSV